MVYDDAPYAMLNYYDDLQAYRSDRFTNMVMQPINGGTLLFQYGTYTYLSVTPVSNTTGAKANKSNTLLYGIAGAVVLVVLLALVLFLVLRRRTADERE